MGAIAITDILWILLPVLTGGGLGAFAALASLRLPTEQPLAWNSTEGDHRALVRYWGMAGLGVMIGIWAGAAHPGPTAEITTILGVWLLLLAVLDAEHLWLPLRLTGPLVAFGLIVIAATDPARLAAHMIGAGAGFGALWTMAFIYRRLRRRDGLGGGDAWLAAAAGAWVGWEALPTVVLIAAGTALVWVAVLALRRKLDASRPIPFGLFLAIGLWLEWLQS